VLLDLSLTELAEKISKKEISVTELVTESFEQTNDLNPQLNDFVTLRQKEILLAEANEKDKTLDSNSSKLHGIPFSLKDAYATQDLETTAGSSVLSGFNPPYDATVYAKLKAAGAILVGKNNQDAFGHGASNENSDYGPVKNPWDLERVAGGSSGGSAASVAAREVAFAIGEDTGGSIRNPANFCNVCGLKVTYGRVSRYGAIAYASSLDTVGPMAKSVADIALLLEHIAGKDPLDGTSSSQPVDEYSKYLTQDVSGKVIGLPKEFFAQGLNPEVKTIVETAIKEFERLGAQVVEVSIPYIEHGVSIYYSLAMSETSSNLARYDGVRYGQVREKFSQENKRRIMGGTFALSTGYADKFYQNALRARTVLIEEYQKAFEKCDILLGPVTPRPAAKMGEMLEDPLTIFLEDLYTVTINTVGVPSLALPAGFTAEGLPVGMQLIGKKFAEGELIQLGSAYQNATDWHTRKPRILK
jgi:aspartyl-tRNA(Asn)/glutamyl-tRNA(Gln) amidotransferase subunit A